MVWESTDLVNWSAPRLLNVAGAIPDGRNAWAPEAIWNPATNDYVLYWATNVPLNGVTKHRIYYARTSDFRTITTPQLYIDRPGTQDIIDTQIVEVPAGVGNYRYVRASGDGQITLEGSNSILGTWTNLGNLSGIGLTGSQVEGPMWMKFSGPQRVGPLPRPVRHRPRLHAGHHDQPVRLRHLPAPGVGQLQPGRHQEAPRLDPEPDGRRGEPRTRPAGPTPRPTGSSRSTSRTGTCGTPTSTCASTRTSAQPTTPSSGLRPGLTGSGTVSFESVNFPGYYLRHDGSDFQLVHNDGTTAVRRGRHLPPGRRARRLGMVVLPVLQPPRPLHPPLRLPAAARPDHHRDGTQRRHLPRDELTNPPSPLPPIRRPLADTSATLSLVNRWYVALSALVTARRASHHA